MFAACRSVVLAEEDRGSVCIGQSGHHSNPAREKKQSQSRETSTERRCRADGGGKGGGAKDRDRVWHSSLTVGEINPLCRLPRRNQRFSQTVEAEKRDLGLQQTSCIQQSPTGRTELEQESVISLSDKHPPNHSPNCWRRRRRSPGRPVGTRGTSVRRASVRTAMAR